jgi:hypothetical protein
VDRQHVLGAAEPDDQRCENYRLRMHKLQSIMVAADGFSKTRSISGTLPR